MPGLRLNLGKRGFSFRIGTRGIGHTIGTAGQRTTFGIPGSGVSFTKVHSRVPQRVATHRYDDVLDHAGPRRIERRKSVNIAATLAVLGLAAYAALHIPNGSLVPLVAVAAAYFLPALIAYKRGHHNRHSILALNALLGWTVLGWIGSLVWSATAVTIPSQGHLGLEPLRADPQ